MNVNIDYYLKDNDPKKLAELLEKNRGLRFSKDFIIRDVGISSRVFAHWMKAGLIDKPDKVDDFKYSFGFVDLFWFNIIKELRQYGMPLNIIKQVKEQLFQPLSFITLYKDFGDEEKQLYRQKIHEMYKDCPEEREAMLELADILDSSDITQEDEQEEAFIYPAFSLFISTLLSEKINLVLMINKQGHVLSYPPINFTEQQLQELISDTEFDDTSFIRISLMKILERFILDKKYIKLVRDWQLLNENELHIISLLRQGRAKQISVKFDKRQPVLLEITEEKKFYQESRLTELLLNKGYQDIEIKTQDGNITYTNITTKKKLQ